MSIMDKFKPLDEPVIDPEPHVQRRIQGRILLINEEGWGFITSREIPFRRIFFHWTFLNNDQPLLTDKSKSHFEQIEEGMIVEFKPLEIPDKGWRAIQIEVVKE